MSPLLRLAYLFRPQAGWLVLGLLLALLTTLAQLVLMGTSGWFITAMGLAGATGVSINYFTPAAVIRACAIVRTSGRYGERLLTHDATLRVLARLRGWLYRKLIPLAPAGLEQERSGTLVSRLGRDIDTLDHFYLRIALPMAVLLLSGLALVAWLWFQSPAMALAEAAGLLLAGGLIPAWLARRGRGAALECQQTLEQLRAASIEGLAGLAELQLLDADQTHARRLQVQARRLARSQLRQARHEIPAQAAITAIAWLTLWVLLVLALPEVEQGLRPPPHLAMLALLALASFEAATLLPAAFQALAPTSEAARRLFQLADRPPPVPEAAGPAPRPGHFGYRLERVTLHHTGSETPALEQIDLELPTGTHTALIGPSGAGKSSLLDLLVRFRLPRQGRLLFAGTDLRRWPEDALHRHLAVVLQQDHLLIGTLRHNLLLARPDADEAQLWQALETAVLDRWVRDLPQGLDTEIGEAALRISGGEARRLLLARALLRDAPVLILDEPFEGLDRSTAAVLMERILAHQAGRTLILVTHDLNVLPRMDQVVLLDQGRLLAQGPHEQLLATSPAYRHLHELTPRL